MRFLKEVCDTAAENQVDKILIDSLEVEGSLAAFERYRLGTELADYLTERQVRLKLAFVGVPPAVNGFGVRIAQNRGVAARVFSCHQQALSWLDDLRVWEGLESAVPSAFFKARHHRRPHGLEPSD